MQEQDLEAAIQADIRDQLLERRGTCRSGHDLTVHGGLAQTRGMWYWRCRRCEASRRKKRIGATPVEDKDVAHARLLARRSTCRKAGHDLTIHGVLTPQQGRWVFRCKLCEADNRARLRENVEERRKVQAGEDKDAIRAYLLARRGNTCKAGHDLRESGKLACNSVGRWHLVCRACNAAWRRARVRAKQPTGLILGSHANLTNRQIGARLGLATRLERYGPSLKSAEGLERWRNAPGTRKRRHHERDKPACKRGHPFTSENTYIYKNPRGWTSRICKECTRLRQGLRPEWVYLDNGRVNLRARDRFFRERLTKLRKIVLASHPDRPGGTHTKFLAARRAEQHFIKRESAWYQSVGMPPPPVKRRPVGRA